MGQYCAWFSAQQGQERVLFCGHQEGAGAATRMHESSRSVVRAPSAQPQDCSQSKADSGWKSSGRLQIDRL